MKVNQIVAIEKGVKTRAYSSISELHKLNQKPDLFNGFVKNYRKKDEDGEDFPSERKVVQFKTSEVIASAREAFTELIDTTASKDYANMTAVADVKVNGEVLITKAPVPFLLFLEKQLTDLHSFITKLPVLDSNDEWSLDTGSGLQKSAVVSTHRTKKVQKPIVLYNATPEHPAQTQLITEDVVVGYWDTTKHSGAIPQTRKDTLLKQTETLLDAVKVAREEANNTDCDKQQVAQNLLDFVFKG